MTIKRSEELLASLTATQPFIRGGKLRNRQQTMMDARGDVVVELTFSKDDDAVLIKPTQLSKSRDCCLQLERWFRDQGLRTVLEMSW